MKNQNENLNLTSIKQEQLTTHDQSCQLTTNENVALFTKPNLTRDFTATKVENCDEKYDNIMKIQIENVNLTSIKQEQLNTHDQSCQLTTNENVAFFTKLNVTRDFTATKVENCDEKHDIMKIQNENDNLTIKQEQLNTHDQSCQLTTNENVALSCQPEEANLKTENIDEEYPLTEEIYIKEEPHFDSFTSNNSDEELQEFEESNSTSSDSENYDQPKQEDTKKQLYKCDKCPKAFTTPSSLERHRCIHSEEKPFHPDVQLQIHKQSQDNNQPYIPERPYQCSECSKSFIKNSSLTTHMRVHTGQKPFQCHICQYKCSISSNLKCHIRLHTGEKPYECSMCSKSFTKNSFLTAHLRKHTGEKPYQCHICEYKCSYSSNLKCHIRSHTGEKPYQCSVCNKSFKENGTLTKHMRVHTGQKPYFCKFCDYKCSYSSNLIYHLRSHTGEKPYQCSVCNKTFRDNGDLSKHRRIHTGQKVVI